MPQDNLAPVLSIRQLLKDYRGLRPLRIESLALRPGERVSITGLDAAAAEVLVNLVTGSNLPDRGEVITFDYSTAAIDTEEKWLAHVDRFGIVSDRVVLLDGYSLAQNLAVPFTLSVDPLAPDIAATVATLAEEVGIGGKLLHEPLSAVSRLDRARCRLARAVALGPDILVLEHPTGSLEHQDAMLLAAEIARVAGRRGTAVLALTADRSFARAVATLSLNLNQATGKLSSSGWLGLL
jgi:lipoprotein-releasing system ATP-binding protein